MSFDHRPGAVVTLMNKEFKRLGEVEVSIYIERENAYRVWWTYPQTGGRELIKVPAWQLVKKEKQVETFKEYYGSH